MNVPAVTVEAASVGPIGCRACDLHEICRLTGLLAHHAGRSRQSTGTLRALKAGERLFRAGDRADRLFAVRQGLLKTVRVSVDGKEELLSLIAPGEVLGLEAFSDGAYACDVIALQPVVCCELPIRLLGDVHDRVGEIDVALIRLLSHAIAPRPNFSRGPIRERVTGFLRDLGRRLENRDLDGRRFRLGLSRQEIADLLDTRIETVSRVLQRLHREDVIQVRGGQIRLVAL